jgi:hypothetical protein
LLGVTDKIRASKRGRKNPSGEKYVWMKGEDPVGPGGVSAGHRFHMVVTDSPPPGGKDVFGHPPDVVPAWMEVFVLRAEHGGRKFSMLEAAPSREHLRAGADPGTRVTAAKLGTVYKMTEPGVYIPGTASGRAAAHSLGRKNPSGDNFKFKSKAELVDRIHRYESRVADMLDDLDQWHRPGSGTQLDKTHKALLKAQTELVKAIEAYDPDFSGPVY